MPGPAGLDISWMTKFVRDQIQQNQLAPQAQARVARHTVDDLTVNSSVVLDGVAQPKVTTSAWAQGPPRDPHDGDIWLAVGVDANGTRWQFQYNVGSSSPYKWEFVGGPPVISEVATVETIITLGAVAGDLATVGPHVTGLRSGDYVATATAVAVGGTVADNMYIMVTAGAVTGTAVSQVTVRTSTDSFPQAGQTLMAALTSGEVRLRYAGNNGSEQWKSRSLCVVPRRIS